MLTDIHNIWHTVYWSSLQYNNYWHVYLLGVLLLYYLECARDASYTSAITVTLTSSSKAVCQHTDVCIRQLCNCSVKLLSLLVLAYDLQLGLCGWMRRLLQCLISAGQYLCGKNGYFSMCACVCHTSDVILCLLSVFSLLQLGCSE